MGARVGSEHQVLAPTPCGHAPATWARLGAEAGEGVQARLTAHGQGGGLAGWDVVGHVALPHEGANSQLLRGLLGPPQAGARWGEEAALGPCWVEPTAKSGPPPAASPFPFF